MTKKKKILTFVLITGILAVATAIFTLREQMDAVNDSYAQWDVALALINYMETNNQNWPTNWNELKEAHKTTENLRGPLSFKELKERVEVDFKTKPSDLKHVNLEKGEPPFKVVWLKNGKTRHWSGAEPNTLIHEYITKEKQNQKVD